MNPSLLNLCSFFRARDLTSIQFTSSAATGRIFYSIFWILFSVADPDHPYVFGPPGSGSASVSQRYGSWSFYHQAKIVRKPWFLLFFDFLMTFYQCCGFGSARIRIHFGQLDPDPHWEYRSGSRRAKITHTAKKIQVLRDEDFFCSFDVLYRGLEISKLRFLIKIIYFLFQL